MILIFNRRASLRNIRLTLEYDGSEFFGWQIQKNKPTVQGEIEKVLKLILKEGVNLIGASRTDAGVHALGQVANFKTSSDIPTFKLLEALNGLLPHSIKVLEVREVDKSFHARFCAKGKSYLYRIFVRKVPSPFEYKRAWHIPYELDEKAMRKALSFFKGTHDFTTFSKKDPSRNPIRTITDIKMKAENNVWAIRIEGVSFLRHMVRVIVATAVECALGKISAEDIPYLFEKRDRKYAPYLAPAYGLYLERVFY